MSELIKRQSVRQMDQQDLQNYRAAMRKIQELPVSDERSFSHIAGIHGLPAPSYCHSDPSLFLPWHRAYVLYLEKSINEMLDRMWNDGSDEITPDIDGFGRETAPQVGVPWWDWTSSISHQNGIPKAFSDHTTPDGLVNPLWETPMELHRERENNQLDWWLYKERNGEMYNTRGMDDSRLPSQSSRALPNLSLINDFIESTDDFMDFQGRTNSDRVLRIHGFIHGWVGGTMSRVPTAGWDPIFFSHHCMVDRIWYLWQLKHNALNSIPGIPESYYRTALAPFKMTVEETMNPRNLGYEYASSSTSVELIS